MCPSVFDEAKPLRRVAYFQSNITPYLHPQSTSDPQTFYRYSNALSAIRPIKMKKNIFCKLFAELLHKFIRVREYYSCHDTNESCLRSGKKYRKFHCTHASSTTCTAVDSTRNLIDKLSSETHSPAMCSSPGRPGVL